MPRHRLRNAGAESRRLAFCAGRATAWACRAPLATLRHPTTVSLQENAMSMGHEHLLEEVARVGQELPAGPVAAGLAAMASRLGQTPPRGVDNPVPAAEGGERTDKDVHPTGNGGRTD